VLERDPHNERREGREPSIAGPGQPVVVSGDQIGKRGAGQIVRVEGHEFGRYRG
jgi:hypothetical protein